MSSDHGICPLWSRPPPDGLLRAVTSGPCYRRATHSARRYDMVRAYVLITATAGKALEVVDRLQAADIAGIGRLVVERVQADGVLKTITCLAVQ